jgi:benzil reductase ((S)-benzoin forming)
VTNSLAIVTGTSRGIGAEVATQLMARGWDVIGVARGHAAISDPRYRHLAFDLRDAQLLAQTFERELAPIVADAGWRRIGLVNNAASVGALGPVEAVVPADFLAMAAVNCVAPAWLTGFVIRRASAHVALRIVNVSSGAAVTAFPGLADYCGTKAALRMIGMVTAAELDSPLRTTSAPADTAILSYEPGIVDTEMQVTARTKPLEDYPWGRMFRDFAANGVLAPPSAPAAEIVTFLEADGHPRFSERRLAQ